MKIENKRHVSISNKPNEQEEQVQNSFHFRQYNEASYNGR